MTPRASAPARTAPGIGARGRLPCVADRGQPAGYAGRARWAFHGTTSVGSRVGAWDQRYELRLVPVPLMAAGAAVGVALAFRRNGWRS
jgi:hypothetical protein